MSERICEHCSIAFTPKRVYRDRPARFCSTACRNDFWRDRRVRVCEQCGETFDPGRVRHDAPHKTRFCGTECYGIWQRDKSSLNGTYHRKIRAQVVERDGHKCRVCGNTHRLRVHHIEPYAEGQSDPHRPSNLVTLCTPCHSHTHQYLAGVEPDGSYWSPGESQ